jgi:hypothetical protein
MEKMLELSEIRHNLTWQKSLAYAKSLGEDWRVPTIQELVYIRFSSRWNEYAWCGYFWSSSPHEETTGSTHVVEFGAPNVSYLTNDTTAYVRCIRGTLEDLLTWCFRDSSAIVLPKKVYYAKTIMPTMIELSPIKQRVTWHEAMTYAQELGEGWRVPERYELDLMYCARELGHPDFQDRADWLWSSTSDADSPYMAWYISFFNGFFYGDFKTHIGSVMCVRGSLVELHKWVEDQRGKNGK